MAGRSLAFALNMLILNDISKGPARPPGAIKPEPAPTVIGKPRAPQGTAERLEPARIRGLGSRFPVPGAAGTRRPGDKNRRHDGGETEPGQRILQMVVGKADDELAGLRQAAGRHRRLLFDIQGGDGTHT